MTSATAATRSRVRLGQIPVDVHGGACWLLGAAPVAYLGLRGGGYDPLVHVGVAIVVWWVVLVAVAVGAVSLRRVTAAGWTALACFGAFVVWSAASVGWSDNPDGAASEAARTALYLGVVVLAIVLPGGPRTVRALLSGVALAIVAVAVAALATRLQLDVLPAGQNPRLSAPLNYWNGLASLSVVGVPLLLGLARSAERIAAQATATAGVPLLVLVAYLTGSRGGVLAGVVAVVAFLLLTGDRLAGLASAAIAAGGTTLLALAAGGEGELLPGPDRDVEGFVALLVVVLAGTALLQVAASLVARYAVRPARLAPNPRRTAATIAVAVVAAAAAGTALGAPGWAADRWSEFTGAPTADVSALTTADSLLDRLGSGAGVGRWQMWQQAADLFQQHPLRGAGAGSFEPRWAAERPAGSVFARNAHSLYAETLGASGLVGLALLVGLLATMLAAGGMLLARRRSTDRPMTAAAVAGLLAFMTSAALDWVWQLPVVAVTGLVVGATLLAPATAAPSRRDDGPWLPRALVLVVAIAAIGGLAVSLTGTANLRDSRMDARQGRLVAAAQSAAAAAAAQPYAAEPQLQLALVLERSGLYDQAAARARTAVAVAPDDWQGWYVSARIDTRRGRTAAAAAASRRARALNPRSTVLTP